MATFDDLEQTLVQVAAAADARNNETEAETIPEDVAENEIEEVVYSKYNEGNNKLKRKIDDSLSYNDSGSSNRRYPSVEKNEDEGPKLKRKLVRDDSNKSSSSQGSSSKTKLPKQDQEQLTLKRKLRRKLSRDEGDEYSQGTSKTKLPELDQEQFTLKRKLEEDENVDTITGHAKVVATHYNALEEKGLDERSKSRIFHMRNFHNWIKSMLINEYLTKIRDGKKHNEAIRVHDMCCGKGGDLQKWRKGNISHLICSDIASVSLEQCKNRYQDMRIRSNRDRYEKNIYALECILADCSRVSLRGKYKDPSIELDLVSCQFAFHYSFESLPQAECMIKNAAECLRPGGFFIGTIPDAYDLIARAQNLEADSFGNNVFNVNFDCDTTLPPFFGAKYHFHLDGVVDCPEFLVYFPLFVKLARKYGLQLVKTEKFRDFYERMKSEGRNLLLTMKSLETYPAQHGAQLVGTADDDYEHAKLCLEKEGGRSMRVGTLSKSEWEASSLYTTFVFEKVKGTINKQGITVYDL